QRRSPQAIPSPPSSHAGYCGFVAGVSCCGLTVLVATDTFAAIIPESQSVCLALQSSARSVRCRGPGSPVAPRAAMLVEFVRFRPVRLAFARIGMENADR